MNVDEQKLLGELFDRTKQAADAPRDPEAEHFILEQVKAQPSAPYLLAQAVIVQEQALTACHERIKALEAQLSDLQSSEPAQGQPGGLLGSIFGGSRSGQPSSEPQTSRSGGPWGAGSTLQDGSRQQGVPPQRGPWAMAPQQAQPQGGGFLQGALSTAAGVAGGALMFEGIKNMIGGHSMFGGSDFGIASTQQGPTGETIVNNYYTGDKDNDAQTTDAETDRYDDASDSSSDAGADDDSSV
jgi:hypothetical protein